MKNMLIWVQSLLTLWDIMNTWKLCKKNRLIQLIEMMSIVDDVEENPTIENDGL